MRAEISHALGLYVVALVEILVENTKQVIAGNTDFEVFAVLIIQAEVQVVAAAVCPLPVFFDNLSPAVASTTAGVGIVLVQVLHPRKSPVDA